MNFTVYILPYDKGNPYQDNLMGGFPAYDFDFFYSSSGLSLRLLFSNLFMKKRAAIVHLHWTHSFLVTNSFWRSLFKAVKFFLVFGLVKIFRVRVVWTVHNLVAHEKKHPKFEIFCNVRIANLCDQIIVHSNYAKKKIVEVYRLFDKEGIITVIPHGNYIDSYPNTVGRTEARRELGVPQEKRVFLFFGQIRSYKGVLELVEAFNKLNDLDSHLIIAGRLGDQKVESDIVRMIGDNGRIQTYFDFIPAEKIQLFMNATDAVVFPFRDIFTSGSLLLAMSFGKAVVLPDLESVREVVNENSSITYDPEIKDGLCGALKSALSKDLHAMGVCALERAQKFDWHDIGQQTNQVYRKALDLD